MSSVAGVYKSLKGKAKEGPSLGRTSPPTKVPSGQVPSEQGDFPMEGVVHRPRVAVKKTKKKKPSHIEDIERMGTEGNAPMEEEASGSTSQFDHSIPVHRGKTSQSILTGPSVVEIKKKEKTTISPKDGFDYLYCHRKDLEARILRYSCRPHDIPREILSYGCTLNDRSLKEYISFISLSLPYSVRPALDKERPLFS